MLETRIYLTNQLGSLLKDYRKSQNISQKELAERTQICQSRISFLENHPENISIGQLMRWLSVLGLEIKIADELPPTYVSGFLGTCSQF